MRIVYLTLLTFYLSITTLSAQTFDLGSWNIVNAKYNLDEKWSVFSEAQLRSLKFYTNFHYLLLLPVHQLKLSEMMISFFCKW